jgi:uncharacterized protein
MNAKEKEFSEAKLIHDLKHFLPAQAPLKDFVHHNTLHAFQEKRFHDGLLIANEIFGYKVYLSLDEFRKLYKNEVITASVLDQVIIQEKGKEKLLFWRSKLLNDSINCDKEVRIGSFRKKWKAHYRIDLDSLVHPTLFRILCSYLDQGISMWSFPGCKGGLIESIRELEKSSFISFFKSQRAKDLLLDKHVLLVDLLKVVVSDENLFSNYVFDQQFAHPGWSGIVASIENNPNGLLDKRRICLSDLIHLELLLEIDALDAHFGDIWAPLGTKIQDRPRDLFRKVIPTEYDEVIRMWQNAYEWSYYNQVLAGIKNHQTSTDTPKTSRFQAMFCIDDRECSIRRYIEELEPACETYGTAGHFNLEFYFQPEHGKFYTKVCPAPLTPKYLIQEKKSKSKRLTDTHFKNQTHSLLGGFILTYTLGFWSGIKMFWNIFFPSEGATMVSSSKHMGGESDLTIEHHSSYKDVDGLQVGFTIDEMVIRVEGLLRSIGLVDRFASLVYVIGHGASSVNNTHYAGYDCGACSGRPGSVNARSFAYMANLKAVRLGLSKLGIVIPESTQFIGGLHDTTRDDLSFYDVNCLSDFNQLEHAENLIKMRKALDLNAKERSRRFESIHTKSSAAKIHAQIHKRSVSLFEPRPELNHATNSLCIVGRRDFTRGLFLDRRAFLNSFDYRVDPEGQYLFNILNAVAPVCGGINLEYYFSKVDNQKLGAGSKLPHNVMGLFGVANGIDGDLRPGLPLQMIEVHDPIRLMVIVEHFPEVVLRTIEKNSSTYEWFVNEWIRLVVVHPLTGAFFLFEDGAFSLYEVPELPVSIVSDLTPVLESETDNLPVFTLKSN